MALGKKSAHSPLSGDGGKWGPRRDWGLRGGRSWGLRGGGGGDLRMVVVGCKW